VLDTIPCYHKVRCVIVADAYDAVASFYTEFRTGLTAFESEEVGSEML
jgi:hypothetical protein